jgi:hypothetical protein
VVQFSPDAVRSGAKQRLDALRKGAPWSFPAAAWRILFHRVRNSEKNVETSGKTWKYVWKIIYPAEWVRTFSASFSGLAN